MALPDPDDRAPEDQAADGRVQRAGFNPVWAVLLILLLGLLAYTVFAVLT